jgi:hypothetical protein
MTAVNSTSFLLLAAGSSVLLLGVLTASIVIGSMRRRAGFQLSDEIEAAAGMEGRWRQRSRAVPDEKPRADRPKVELRKGSHAAA